MTECSWDRVVVIDGDGGGAEMKDESDVDWILGDVGGYGDKGGGGDEEWDRGLCSGVGDFSFSLSRSSSSSSSSLSTSA